MKRYKKKFSLAVISLALPILFIVIFALFKWGYGRVGVASAKGTSLQTLTRLAEQGDAKAEFQLGNSYKYGKGVPANEAEAARWFRKAADQGDALAQCSLGVAYILGKGVEASDEAAVMWFRKSAGQGDILAQNNLGNAYYFGRGVKKDVPMAYGWFLLAAGKGNTQAAEMVTLIEDSLSPAEKQAARSWAKQWTPYVR